MHSIYLPESITNSTYSKLTKSGKDQGKQKCDLSTWRQFPSFKAGSEVVQNNTLTYKEYREDAWDYMPST